MVHHSTRLLRKTFRFPWAADEPRANRMLVMKAPPTGRREFSLPSFMTRCGGASDLTSHWTSNTSTAIQRDFFKGSTYFSYADLKSVY